MTYAPQEPGVLNVSFSRGEAWSKVIDFTQPSSLEGYTITAGLYSTITGAVVQAITCDVINPAAAQVSLSLTAAQTTALPAGTYDFMVSWGPSARRVYQGVCEVFP